jgi:hypothetical protein
MNLLADDSLGVSDFRCLWGEGTHYQGHVVPGEILDEIYAVSEMERYWLEGGRDMELSYKAWHILNTWVERQ